MIKSCICLLILVSLIACLQFSIVYRSHATMTLPKQNSHLHTNILLDFPQTNDIRVLSNSDTGNSHDTLSSKPSALTKVTKKETENTPASILSKIGNIIHSGSLNVCKIKSIGPSGDKAYGLHPLCDRNYDKCGLISYGVEYEYTFEVQVKSLIGCSVIAMDPTVNHKAELAPDVRFFKYGAPMPASRNTNKWKIVAPHEAANHFDTDSHLLLKMDCEGCEYSIQDTVPGDFFQRVDQFAIEVHIAKSLGLKSMTELTALANLYQTLENAGLELAHVMLTHCAPHDEASGVLPELIRMGYHVKGKGMCQNLLFARRVKLGKIEIFKNISAVMMINSNTPNVNLQKKQPMDACPFTPPSSGNGAKGGGWAYTDDVIATQHVTFDSGVVAVLSKILYDQSVTDIGAGVGQLGVALKQIKANVKWRGFDGGHNIQEYEGKIVNPRGSQPGQYVVPRVCWIDATNRAQMSLIGQTDWVVSIEVGEHIEKASEQAFLDNLAIVARRGIILSWAVPGQTGYGHVNEQSNAYVIQQLAQRQFTHDATVSKQLRQSVKTLSWLKNTLAVFLRNEKAVQLVNNSKLDRTLATNVPVKGFNWNGCKETKPFKWVSGNLGNMLQSYFELVAMSLLKSCALHISPLILIPGSFSLPHKIVPSKSSFLWDGEQPPAVLVSDGSLWVTQGARILHAINPVIQNTIEPLLNDVVLTKNQIVIHFRCSDSPINRHWGYEFLKYHFYFRALETLNATVDMPVILLSCTAWNDERNAYKTKCALYSTKLVEVLTDAGFQVDIECGKSVEEDFSRMVKARRLISGGCGSSLAYMAALASRNLAVIPSTIPEKGKRPTMANHAHKVRNGLHILHLDNDRLPHSEVKDYSNIELVHSQLSQGMQAVRKKSMYLRKNVFDRHDNKRIVVTGASSNHFTTLLAFIQNYEMVNRFKIPLVVYDLGLSNKQRSYLQNTYKRHIYVTFPYSKYPSHMNIRFQSGYYAWKPVIVLTEMLLRVKINGSILWLDSGNRLKDNNGLKYMFESIERRGFLTTTTGGSVSKFVHKDTYNAMNVKEIKEQSMCNGALVGFKNTIRIRDSMLIPWKQCALEKQCIAPEGSSRANHRQDQAVLTVLAHKNSLGCAADFNVFQYVMFHADDDTTSVFNDNNKYSGSLFSEDQQRIITLSGFAPLKNQQTLNAVPHYMHSANKLVNNPDLQAKDRKPPVLWLDAYDSTKHSSPDMTIIMPIYNSAEGANMSLSALFTYTTGSWELIVILDACHDASFDVVVAHIEDRMQESSCIRVRIVNQPTPVGEASCENIAMRMSTPIVYMLVQVDNIVMEQGWNERMLYTMKITNVFAVSARCGHAFDMQSDMIGRCGDDIGTPLSPRIDKSVLHIRNTVIRGPLLLNASVTQKVGFFDEKNWFLDYSDHDLMFRVTQMGYSVGYLPVNIVAPLSLTVKRNQRLRNSIPLSVSEYNEKYAAYRKSFRVHTFPSVLQYFKDSSTKQFPPFVKREVLISRECLVLMVLSRRDNFERRQAIRETWGKGHNNVFFIVGDEPCQAPEENWDCPQTLPTNAAHISKEAAVTERLKKEPGVVMVPMKDYYRNLPQKLKLAYKWVLKTYPNTQYILKTDDDSVVRVNTLEQWLLSLPKPTAPTVFGGIHKSVEVPRSGKWAEPVYKPSTYPPFAIGSVGHIVSRDIADYIVKKMQKLHNYQGEDTSLGIWLDESPLKDRVQWIDSPHMTNHGQCKDTNKWVIGHNIGVAQMRTCYTHKDELQ